MVVWYGGLVWWFGIVVWYCGLVWYGLVWFGMVAMVWYGLACHNMCCDRMVWYIKSILKTMMRATIYGLKIQPD